MRTDAISAIARQARARNSQRDPAEQVTALETLVRLRGLFQRKPCRDGHAFPQDIGVSRVDLHSARGLRDCRGLQNYWARSPLLRVYEVKRAFSTETKSDETSETGKHHDVQGCDAAPERAASRSRRCYAPVSR
jgi:hypothetical protein